MSKKKRFGVSQALSRGLSETIHVVENNSGIFRNVILPLSRIELDPDNPRKLAISISDIQEGIGKDDIHYERKLEELEKLNTLANTIQKSGIINPIVVYKRGEVYRVVAGERRCLASMLAKRLEIEARVFNEKPKGFELKLVQWIENTAREDLTLNERINNIRDVILEYQLQNSEASLTATLIKNITGLSLPQATCYMSILCAPDDVKYYIENDKIHSLDKAVILANLESHDVRKQALEACINGCSLKELRKLVSQEKLNKKDVTKPNKKRGRAVSRINMGHTINTVVIQTLIESVIKRMEYQKYATIFLKVDWKHLEQVSQAFKKLIQILEHDTVR